MSNSVARRVALGLQVGPSAGEEEGVYSESYTLRNAIPEQGSKDSTKSLSIQVQSQKKRDGYYPGGGDRGDKIFNIKSIALPSNRSLVNSIRTSLQRPGKCLAGVTSVPKKRPEGRQVKPNL